MDGGVATKIKEVQGAPVTNIATETRKKVEEGCENCCGKRLDNSQCEGKGRKEKKNRGDNDYRGDEE